MSPFSEYCLCVAADVPLVCVRKPLPQRPPPRSSAGRCYAGRCRPLRSYPGEPPFRTGWGRSRVPPMACGDQQLQRRTASMTTISPWLHLGPSEIAYLPRVSTPGGLLAAVLRAEVVLGVGASAWDVGVLALDTGVVDFSFCNHRDEENRPRGPSRSPGPATHHTDLFGLGGGGAAGRGHRRRAQGGVLLHHAALVQAVLSG